MATQMLQRRGTAAEWAAANEVLGEAALGLEEDTDIIKMGDGVTPWNDLADDRVYIPLSQQDARYSPIGAIPSGIVDAAGDLIVATGDGTVTRLPKGTSGSRLTVQPDGTLAWVDLPPAANPFTGVDAAGDLLVGSAPDTVARLPVGAEGKILGIVGGLPAWMTPAAADLSSRVAKTGDTMTGELKMRSGSKVRLSPGAGDVNTDPVLRGAAGKIFSERADGVRADFDANRIDGVTVYDGGNRVYSASNPPPASGMQLLAVTPRNAVTGAGTTFANTLTFVAPSSGKVFVHGGMRQASGNAFISLDSAGTVQDNLVNNNGSTGSHRGGIGYTGLTPGATYTIYTNSTYNMPIDIHVIG